VPGGIFFEILHPTLHNHGDTSAQHTQRYIIKLAKTDEITTIDGLPPGVLLLVPAGMETDETAASRDCIDLY